MCGRSSPPTGRQRSADPSVARGANEISEPQVEFEEYDLTLSTEPENIMDWSEAPLTAVPVAGVTVRLQPGTAGWDLHGELVA